MNAYDFDSRPPKWYDWLFACLLIALTIALAYLIGQSTAKAQWGPRGCPGQGISSPAFVPQRDHFEWKESAPGDEGRIYLYKNHIQIGGWDYEESVWRSYDALRDEWGPKEMAAPVPVPAQPERFGQHSDWRTNGVDESRPRKKHAFSINGKEVSERQAYDQLKLVDDSDKLWLVLIGSEESRKKVLADLEGEPKYAEFRKRVRVWSVPPDHFSLMDRETGKPMFENAGNPSIYLLQPNGEELFQKNSYVISDLEDLRKADPSVKKPDDAKKKDSTPSPVPTNQGVPGWVLIGGLGVLAFTLIVKGKK